MDKRDGIPGARGAEVVAYKLIHDYGKANGLFHCMDVNDDDDLVLVSHDHRCEEMRRTVAEAIRARDSQHAETLRVYREALEEIAVWRESRPTEDDNYVVCMWCGCSPGGHHFDCPTGIAAAAIPSRPGLDAATVEACAKVCDDRAGISMIFGNEVHEAERRLSLKLASRIRALVALSPETATPRDPVKAVLAVERPPHRSHSRGPVKAP